MKTKAAWIGITTAGVSIALAVLAWLLLAPTQVGGQTSYAVVSGSSMEPGFGAGDLAILRPAGGYQIGDVVAYRDGDVGALVLHRIAGREGLRYVLKGDNNDWLDPYQPTEGEIVGQLWLDVPKVGDVLKWLRTPLNAAIIAGAAALMAMGGWTAGGRLRRPKGQAAPLARDPPSLPLLTSTGQMALTGLGILAAASLILGLLAFARPDKQMVASSLPYDQRGGFTYSAVAPDGLYDGRAVTTGDPIFLKLTQTLDVGFQYELATESPHATTGTYRLLAEVSDSSGWKRTIELVPETLFSGDRLTVAATIDLGQVQGLLDTMEAQTGLRRNSYGVAVLPNVRLSGTIAGQEVQDTFSLPLSFTLDQVQGILIPPQTPLPGQQVRDPFRPTATGSLEVSQQEPNQLSLLVVPLDVTVARLLSVIGGALSLVGLLALVLLGLRARNADEPSRIRAHYGYWLIPVRDAGPKARNGVVDVATMESLVRLAEHYDAMILHEESGELHAYLVQAGEVMYRYQPSDGTAAEKDPFPILTGRPYPAPGAADPPEADSITDSGQGESLLASHTRRAREMAWGPEFRRG